MKYNVNVSVIVNQRMLVISKIVYIYGLVLLNTTYIIVHIINYFIFIDCKYYNANVSVVMNNFQICRFPCAEIVCKASIFCNHFQFLFHFQIKFLQVLSQVLTLLLGIDVRRPLIKLNLNATVIELLKLHLNDR